MMIAADVYEWLGNLKPDTPVAIDEGGLCLCADHDMRYDGTDNYIEIGGFPDEEEFCDE